MSSLKERVEEMTKQFGLTSKGSLKQDVDALFLLGAGVGEWERIYAMCMSMEIVDGGRGKCGEVAELMGSYGELLGRLGRLAESFAAIPWAT